ncbi:SIMPL domain-containing protein [Streptomyces sp. NBRC 14336]|uniref:SIMPL domain-containing protein n=1 Tax=Streptomyces sp. NBRC 14336 TaxID=3030992 RepID=UPI0024A46358|nr:SIMPL domain-containing protein [Streptomyces sp. NBRC 14336]WBO77373.1 SIMPL domain-containing protein [Streptomyces sp. SBE_14.2]GLW47919.1 SIMPL domain-containing protein [Streptomyces sp. NBRC 14336]
MTEMIKGPWGISVFGAGDVRAEPQLVRVKLGVSVLEPTPEKAFREADAAVTRLREVLREHRIPDASVSGSRLRLNSEHDFERGTRKHLGYGCSAQYVIETEALDNLRQLMVDVVSAGVRSIDSVEFDVHDKPALRDEARRRAVAAARRKAEVYADAAGVHLGPVVHIQDVDAESYEFRQYRGHSTGGAASANDLAPGMVQVAAAVLLGFSLTH